MVRGRACYRSAEMAYVTAFVGLVALLQGVAWIGGHDVSARDRFIGGALAPLGLLAFAFSVLTILVPAFWRG